MNKPSHPTRTPNSGIDQTAIADAVESLLLHRTTVQHFSDRAVPSHLIDRALACAIAAPNHRMTEPWRFIQIGPQTRQEITKIRIALLCGDRGVQATDAIRAKATRKIESPSHLLVAVQKRSDDPYQDREDYAACACAIQNIATFLAAHEVGSKWGSGAVTTDPRTYTLLGLDPIIDAIIGFIWIGYPSVDPVKPKRKLSASDVLTRRP